ncbi:hypothetical protein FFK04_07510 [Ruminococcus sp. KGMB03662]|nr:hypothetical protein FFK04_07510 [Ruminococcus sp. KGMB03662]
MTLEQYLKDKQVTQSDLTLIEKLKKFSTESDFIIGVLVYAETKADREQLIEYINNGKDVSYESILLYALELDLNRNE